MKKYLAAAAVAVMVFAFSAFAASLDVKAGSLAAGSDNVNDCGGIADLTYTTEVAVGSGGHQFWVDTVTATFGDDSCDGERASISFAGDEFNSQTWQGMKIADDPVAGNTVTFDIPDGGLDVADVGNIAILVGESGPAGWTNIPL